MEGLLGVVEQVRRRIEQHRAELQKSEALTRYALIDPILRALGWNTEDSEQVKPEFITKKGRADYALLQSDKLLVVIEAKPLDSDLESAQSQGVNYCVTEGIPYFICTDGKKWELYDVFRSVPLEQKRAFEADLLNERPGEAARKLLALWRPAMDKLEVAPRPIVQPPPPPPTGITLRELRTKVKPHDKPPSSIHFPDGQQEPLNAWRDLLIAAAEWVAPKLQKRQLPIRTMRGDRLLLNSEPRQSNGQQFHAPKRIGRFWLESNWSARGCVRHACRLLEAVGLSPDTVRVEF